MKAKITAPAPRSTRKAAVLRFDIPVLAAEDQILKDLIDLATRKYRNRWKGHPQDEMQRTAFWSQLRSFVTAWSQFGPRSVG